MEMRNSGWTEIFINETRVNWICHRGIRYLRGKKKQVFKLTYELQERWTGPFHVVKVISSILYGADIKGVIKRVHAVNMKPGPSRTLNAMTQRVEQYGSLASAEGRMNDQHYYEGRIAAILG